MAVSEEFVSYLHDQFSDLGKITVKRMFGGAGIYFGGAIFALADNNVLYMKVGAATRSRFEAAGCKPFEPWPGHVMAGYWTVAADVQEDRQTLAQWARDALADAAPKPKRETKRKPKRRK